VVARKKTRVKLPHSVRHVAFLNYEADVDFGSALRNHANVDSGICDGAKNAGCDSGTAMDVFSDEANNGLLVLGRDISNVLQFGQQRSRKTPGFHGKRHTYF
jgi:hypothetical protein